MKGSRAPSPGGQSEGWVMAKEQIQYQWPWIYLEKRFLILSQTLPSVRLTLSEKLGQEEMGREGKGGTKPTQKQKHKSEFQLTNFQRCRGGGRNFFKKRKKINLGNVMAQEGEEGKADPGWPPRRGAQGPTQGQKCLPPGLYKK